MSPRPGDFFVQRGYHIYGAIIRFVTRSDVNHAGLYLGDGKVVESLSQGAVVNPAPDDAIWSNLPLTAEQREAIVREGRNMIGTGYGWLDVAAVGLLQFGIKAPFILRRLRRTDKLFCSQLVDEAYRRAGVHLFRDGRASQDVTPGDLHRVILDSGETNGNP